MNSLKEKSMKLVFLIAACMSVLAVALICVFLFANGVPAIKEIGLFEFLLGERWKPTNDFFGVLPFIMGSIYVTAGAIIVGVPVALFAAIFMARYCPKILYRPMRSAINLMAGIPSVVYGFFGLILIVPMIREVTGKDGSTMLAASLLLGIMILPTVIGVTEAALRSVPNSYYEGALALGATHERSIFFTVVPAAKSGIVAGIVLGIGRAVGETMAVIMVAGNQTWMPQGLLKGLRTLTSNIVMEMGYAADLHRKALIATGVVLFVFILIINVAVSLLSRRTGNGK